MSDVVHGLMIVKLSSHRWMQKNDKSASVLISLEILEKINEKIILSSYIISVIVLGGAS